MSSDMTSLAIDITADGSSAQAELEQLNVRLSELEKAFNATSTSSTEASSSIEKVGVVSKDASSGLEAMAGHAGTVGRAFSAMGLEAEGAAARIEGMVGVFKEMSAAVPELLAIGAALVAISGTFDFLKEAIGSASELQSQMETLRAAVEAQGGAWDSLQGKILDFVHTESLASGFTENELVAAMNQLVTAGTSVADSMTLVSVAEETAVAHHMSVLEVTKLLIEAEAGRGQGLARLDPQIRSLISAHADLSQVLDVLHHDNAKQIEDSDSLERATRLNKAAWEELSNALGSVFLPVATAVENAIAGIILNLERMAKGISEMLHNLPSLNGPEGKGFYQGWSDFMHGLNDDIPTTAAQAQADAQKKHNARFAGGVHLDNDPSLGLSRARGGGGAGGGVGYSAQDVQALAVDEAALTTAHNALAKSGDLVASAYVSMKTAIDPTMDSQKQNEIAIEKLQRAYTDATADVQKQISAINRLSDATRDERTAVDQKHAAYTNAVGALNAYEQSLDGVTKLSAQQKNELNALKDKVKEADTAYKDADKSLKDTTKALSDHEKQLESDTKAINAFNAEQQKMIVGLNDAKEAADKKVRDDEATYGKSLEDQLAYFKQRLENAISADAQYFDLHHAHNQDLITDEKDYYQKVSDLQLQAWKQQQDTAKKAQQQETTDVSNFLDDIIVKHKSFKDVFKQIWDDIVKIFIEDIAKMIAESALFKTVFSNVGGAGAGFMGALGSIFGGGGGSFSPITSNASPFDTAELFGAPGSSAASALHVNIAGAAPGVFGSGSGGGFGGLGGGGGSIGTLGTLGVLGAAFGLGSVESKFTGGNSTNSGIGAALGVGALGVAAGWGSGLTAGLSGLIAAGPAGWALLLGAGLIGGAAGGLFGPKGPTPDTTDTQNYEQGLANISGAGYESSTLNSNGATFNESSSLASSIGNQGQGDFIKKWIAANPQEAAKVLSPQEISFFSGNFGSANNGNWGWGDLKGNNVTLLNGVVANYQDLINAANDATQKIQGLGNAAGSAASALTPIYNVTHSFPDWQNPQVALGGNYTPGGPSIPTTPGSPTSAPPSTSPPGTSPPSGVGGVGGAPTSPINQPIIPRERQPMAVSVTVSGVVGMTADDLVNHVAAALPDALSRNSARALQTTF